LKAYAELPPTPTPVTLAVSVGRPAISAQTEASVSFDVSASETAYGNARWSVRRVGSDSVRLPVSRLRELAADCVNREEFLDAVREELDERLSDDPVECSDDDDGFDYSEHETTDSDDFEQSVDNLEGVVDRFLRDHPDADPDNRADEEE
jgi:hypothetical protein